MDRNNSLESKQIDPSVSLSARRAWIEIRHSASCWRISGSLSARRAWIEIPMASSWYTRRPVALRKESVDRNNGAGNSARKQLSRSPQGERG